MSAFESEAALQEFISRYLDRHAMGVLIRQLQGRLRTGVGDPNGAVSAVVGTLYLRSDGGASTTLYVKESGTGSSGWVAK